MSSFGNKHETFFHFCAWLKIPALPLALETFAYSYQAFGLKFFPHQLPVPVRYEIN